MGETPEWDAVSARFCKLEMPTPGEVMDLFGAYGKLLVERDTLAAELVALRAGLPRWRKGKGYDGFELTKDDVFLGFIEESSTEWRSFLTYSTSLGRSKSKEAARARVERHHALPPCGVEGE